MSRDYWCVWINDPGTTGKRPPNLGNASWSYWPSGWTR